MRVVTAYRVILPAISNISIATSKSSLRGSSLHAFKKTNLLESEYAKRPRDRNRKKDRHLMGLIIYLCIRKSKET